MMTTRRRNPPVEDFLNRLLPQFPLLESEAIRLYESGRNGKDYITNEEKQALARSRHRIMTTESQPADKKLASALADIAGSLMGGEDPSDPHKSLLINGVRGIKIEKALGDWSKAYNLTQNSDTDTKVLANQVVLSRTGGLYKELRERAIALWLGGLEVELLTSMVTLLKGAPTEHEAHQQLTQRLQRAFGGKQEADHVRALAFTSRKKLLELLHTSPLSKLWTPERMAIFSDRLAPRSSSTESASKRSVSNQAEQGHLNKIGQSAPAVLAVLSFPRNAREHNCTQEEIEELLRYDLWSA